MFEVIDNMEMPKGHHSTAKKFPDLQIGQGFVFSTDGYKGRGWAQSSVFASYKQRGQKVTTCSTPDGKLAVKRIA